MFAKDIRQESVFSFPSFSPSPASRTARPARGSPHSSAPSSAQTGDSRRADCSTPWHSAPHCSCVFGCSSPADSWTWRRGLCVCLTFRRVRRAQKAPRWSLEKMVQHLSLNRKHTVSINNFIPKSRCVSISDDRIYSANLDNRIARLQHRIKNHRKNKKTQKYSPYRCTTVAWDRKLRVVDSGFLKSLKCSWCFAVLICCCCCRRRLTEKERARVGWHSQSAERVLRRAQKVAVQSPQLTKENVNFFQSASSKSRISFGISLDSPSFPFLNCWNGLLKASPKPWK